MVQCTCTECKCGDTWSCLHHPDGSYCKCCVDDSTANDDGMIYHKEYLMKEEVKEKKVK